MREFAVFFRAIRDDLIGGHGHGRDFLHVARISGHERVIEVGLVQNLALPLLDGRRAGGQDEGLLAQSRHRGDAHDRLPGAAGQDDHPRTSANVAPGVEGIDRHFLIVADAERQARTRGFS